MRPGFRADWPGPTGYLPGQGSHLPALVPGFTCVAGTSVSRWPESELGGRGCGSAGAGVSGTIPGGLGAAGAARAVVWREPPAAGAGPRVPSTRRCGPCGGRPARRAGRCSVRAYAPGSGGLPRQAPGEVGVPPEVGKSVSASAGPRVPGTRRCGPCGGWPARRAGRVSVRVAVSRLRRTPAAGAERVGVLPVAERAGVRRCGSARAGYPRARSVL